jgi:hypothetical protein
MDVGRSGQLARFDSHFAADRQDGGSLSRYVGSMTKHLRLWLLGLLSSLAFTPPVSAASFDADPSSSCAVRVHYPQPVAPAAEVFVLAVGTAMPRSSYDSLGAQVTGKG